MLDRGELPFRVELEDIHMHIEQTLIDRLGDTGRRLHTAFEKRSNCDRSPALGP